MGNGYDEVIESWFSSVKGESSYSSNNPSTDEIANVQFGNFEKDGFFTDFVVGKSKVKKIRSKKIPNEIIRQTLFERNIMYGFNIGGCLLNSEKLNKTLEREILAWEIKGGACIYNSILLYSLFESSQIIDMSKLKFNQGFYKYNLREDFPPYIPWAKINIGLHAFLTYDGSILDFNSVPQNVYHFNFDKTKTYALIGNIPDGFNVYGFEESEDVINKYRDLIIKTSNFDSYEEWLNFHELQSTADYLKDLLKH